MEKGVSVISRTISITTCFERKAEPKKKSYSERFFFASVPATILDQILLRPFKRLLREGLGSMASL